MPSYLPTSLRILETLKTLITLAICGPSLKNVSEVALEVLLMEIMLTMISAMLVITMMKSNLFQDVQK